MRKRQKASPPGSPPSAHTSGGLREINFHVDGSSSIIGPRKFARSNFFNRPVPNIHEVGGVAIASGLRNLYSVRYPERSFMWAAVKSLKRKGKINSTFNTSLRRM